MRYQHPTLQSVRTDVRYRLEGQVERGRRWWRWWWTGGWGWGHTSWTSWTGPPRGKRAPRVGISSTVFGVRGVRARTVPGARRARPRACWEEWSARDLAGVGSERTLPPRHPRPASPVQLGVPLELVICLRHPLQTHLSSAGSQVAGFEVRGAGVWEEWGGRELSPPGIPAQPGPCSLVYACVTSCTTPPLISPLFLYYSQA